MPDSPNPSPTQEVETGHRWKLWRRRSGRTTVTGAGATGADAIQIGGEVEVMPVEDHQRLLRAEVEKREEAQATIRRMDAANVAALESVDAWDDPSGFNGVVSNIKRLGERAKAAESRLSSVEAELERQANSEEVVYTTNRQGARDALQLLRDKNTAPNAIHEEAEPGSSSSPIAGGTEQGGGDGD